MLLLFKTIFTGRILLELSTPLKKSLMDCSMYCYNESRCQSFFYSRWNPSCSITLQRYENASGNLTDLEGVQYREKRNDYCPLDYTLLPEASICIKLILKEGNFSANQQTCAEDSQGGRMAVLDTGAKFTGVRDYLGVRTEGLSPQQSIVMVGGTNGMVDETTARSGITLWCPKQPSDVAGPTCLLMKYKKTVGHCLNDIICSRRSRFLCEKPMYVI